VAKFWRRCAQNWTPDEGVKLATMNCWHMLMGKGYNLLASSSGSAPRSGNCTPASLTAKFTSSDDDADNEHEEMVNEFQAMVLIGNEWANAPEDSTAQDNILPSTFDLETATIRGTANQDGDIWNNINSTTHDESRSDPAPENIDAAENVSTKLYSTGANASSIVQSALETVDVHSSPIDDKKLLECNRDELLPFPVYRDAWLLPEESPSTPILSPRCTGGQLDIHVSDVKVLDDVEMPNEVEFRKATISTGHCNDEHSAPVSRTQAEGQNSNEEIKDLVDHHTSDSDVQPRARASSSSQHDEQTEATPRRSSQLSETLRNNLERLLQRGPVSTTMNDNGRRRRTRRDDGLRASGKRQMNTLHKQQHRRYHQHHRHHHYHPQQQQYQEQNEEESGLHSIPDDDLSLITDTETVRSCSITSTSDTSSVSDGIFPTYVLTCIIVDIQGGPKKLHISICLMLT